MPESVEDTAFGRRIASESDHYGLAQSNIDALHEFAGRACYQAWELKNPTTAENEGYLANIIEQNHGSVLEHGSATFYVEGISRSLTHELIRHRHLSYSELSQRYVDMSETQTIIPPAILELMADEGVRGQHGKFLKEDVERVEYEALDRYDRIVEALIYRGCKRKEAREAARAVLPGGFETKMVVTGNLRAWRDVIGRRHHVAADKEIAQFAGMVLEHLRTIAPASVQDIPTEPFQ